MRITNVRSIYSIALIGICFLSVSAPAQAQPASKIIAHFSGTNGSNPASQLIQLPGGNLLGLTLTAVYYPKIPSTIFQILNTGAIETLYTLAADGSQGAMNGGQFMNNGLVQASDGSIYGLTASSKLATGEGLVFRFTFPSTFEVLHQFNYDPNNCAGAVGSLVEAADGYLYGVASEGGANGAGAIFRVGLDGSFSKVYDFVGTGVIGGLPFFGLTAHPNGLLYGVTDQGTPNHGSVFQFDPESAQVQFVGGAPTEEAFLSGVTVGSDGGLYVVGPPTPSCGSCTGTLTRYGTDGTGPETIFTFPTGVYPGPGLVESSAGVFLNDSYPALLIDTGTNTLTQIPIPSHIYSGIQGNLTETAGGEFFGAYPETVPIPFYGAIVEISGGFPKPLPSITGVFPVAAAPGESITVLGNYFVGATAVMLAGDPVPFSVKASGIITFSAPATAVSGVVSVTTPGGVATSVATLSVN